MINFEDVGGTLFVFFKKIEIFQYKKETHVWCHLSLYIELGLKFMHLIHKDRLQEVGYVYLYYIWMQELQAQAYFISLQGRVKIIDNIDTIELGGCSRLPIA
jgi:hypothetical protein